jgi:hypothetical protein
MPSFEEWVDYVLTQAVSENEFLWESCGFIDSDDDDAQPPRLKAWLRHFSQFHRPSTMSIWQETVYRSRLLNDPQPIVERYSAHQLVNVFDLLFDSGDEFHVDLLNIPFSVAFYSRYLDALASFYVRFLDMSLPESPGKVWCDRVNQTAFMMWDGRGPSYFPVAAQMPCLERILFECESEACVNCALHGLGHLAWYDEWRPACADMIDRFLAERPDMNGVRQYALDARQGGVM